jgi:hypothetical protein
MNDSQGFSTKKIMPIKTIEQIAASYLIAEIIAEIRQEIELKNDSAAIEFIPALDVSVSEDIKKLYEDAVKIAKYKPILVYMIKYAIEDMVSFNFKGDPSVIVAASGDTAHLQAMFSSSFTTLAKVSLFDHTINVFEEAIISAKKTGRSSGVVIPMIASLLHDFGKSSGIRDKILGEAGSRGYKAHAEVSSSYVRDILSAKLYNKFNEIPADTIELLSNLVKNHHPANNKVKTDPGVAFVISADHNARRKEYATIVQSRN